MAELRHGVKSSVDRRAQFDPSIPSEPLDAMSSFQNCQQKGLKKLPTGMFVTELPASSFAGFSCVCSVE